MTCFGEKTAWWAFQTTDVDRVRELVLGPSRGRPIDWDAGVTASYEGSLLVTPAIDGFVLATSTTWLDLWRDNEMSERATDWVDRTGWAIQYYASDRITSFYGWGRLDEDFTGHRELVKHADDCIDNLGTITAAERALVAALLRDGAPFGFPDADIRSRALDRACAALAAFEVSLAGATVRRGPLADTPPDDVPTLAALLVAIGPDHVASRWSVDPNTLDERDPAVPGPCWVGDPS